MTPNPRRQDSPASLLRRLTDAMLRSARSSPADASQRRLSLDVICPRCRLPMTFTGSAAEERVDGGEPCVRNRWRCSRCGAASAGYS